MLHLRHEAITAQTVIQFVILLNTSFCIQVLPDKHIKSIQTLHHYVSKIRMNTKPLKCEPFKLAHLKLNFTKLDN